MIKIGFVPSHRAPFNRDWAVEMRKRTIRSIKGNVLEAEFIYPNEDLTDGGLITNEEDTQKTVKLFKENNIQGLIIGTMTFGEELDLPPKNWSKLKVSISNCPPFTGHLE